MRVVAIAEDAALAAHHAVERPRDSHLEPLHPARERLFALCLDQPVQMIPLHRIMDEPEPEPLAPGMERRLVRTQGPEAPQIPAASLDPQRDVDRVARGELGSLQMWHARALRALPASPRAPAAPPMNLQLCLHRLITADKWDKSKRGSEPGTSWTEGSQNTGMKPGRSRR